MTDDFYLYKPTAKSHFKLCEPIQLGCVVWVWSVVAGEGGGGTRSSLGGVHFAKKKAISVFLLINQK